MKDDALITKIRALYDAQPLPVGVTPIHPFVGDAYAHPTDGDLRIVAVGINSYVDKADWTRVRPSWFAQGFAHNYRFFRVVATDCRVLGAALESSPLFAGRRYRDLDTLYLTNAVKAYLPSNAGKEAAQVHDAQYEHFVPTWQAEIDLLADANALPHVIAVFGDPQWRYVYESFLRPPRYEQAAIVSYQSVAGDLHHRLNRIELSTKAGSHTVLLVKLTHPRPPQRTWAAKRLVEHNDFRREAKLA